MIFTRKRQKINQTIIKKEKRLLKFSEVVRIAGFKFFLFNILGHPNPDYYIIGGHKFKAGMAYAKASQIVYFPNGDFISSICSTSIA